MRRKGSPNLGDKRQHGPYVKIYQPDHENAWPSGYIFEHIVIAEKALGHILPKGAEVHHANNIGIDNRNDNLVICENHAYHLLLHTRMRAIRACGNPNYRKCWICKQWDDPKNLHTHKEKWPVTTPRMKHLSCQRKYTNERNRRIRKMMQTAKIT